MHPKLNEILNALRMEVLSNTDFKVMPLTLSVSGVTMNQYEPIKAVVKVTFAPLCIVVNVSEK